MWMIYMNNSAHNVHKMCTKNIASYKSYIDVQFCSQYTMEYINTLKQTKKKTVHYKYWIAIICPKSLNQNVCLRGNVCTEKTINVLVYSSIRGIYSFMKDREKGREIEYKYQFFFLFRRCRHAHMREQVNSISSINNSAHSVHSIS